MVHTHCAGGNGLAGCMKDLNPAVVNTCHKGYPHPFQEETIIPENEYPLYRRRNTNQSFDIPVAGSRGTVTALIDNRRVVRYNPYLSLRYNAHKMLKCAHRYVL